MSDTQLCRATLLLNKVACLTSRVAQLLMSWAIKLLDRNHLCSSIWAILCSVAELWLVSCCLRAHELRPDALIACCSTTDNYVVVCVTRSYVCLPIVCQRNVDSCLGNFVEQQSCMTLLRVWHGPNGGRSCVNWVSVRTACPSHVLKQWHIGLI